MGRRVTCYSTGAIFVLCDGQWVTPERCAILCMSGPTPDKFQLWCAKQPLYVAHLYPGEMVDLSSLIPFDGYLDQGKGAVYWKSGCVDESLECVQEFGRRGIRKHWKVFNNHEMKATDIMYMPLSPLV